MISVVISFIVCLVVGITELITMSAWVVTEVCFVVIKGKGTVCTLYGKCTLANLDLDGFIQ